MGPARALSETSVHPIMSTQPLYDFTPLVSLLVVGALLALGPLVWVHWRNRHAAPLRRPQALRVFTLFLTFDLVLFGAFTRLTDSGLGCPDWPGCYGRLDVPDEPHQIAEANESFPHRPVEPAKAWKEMVHRYFAGALGLLALALAVLAWLKRSTPGQPVALPLGLLALIAFQALLGMWTVTWQLKPVVVMAHLLGGLTTHETSESISKVPALGDIPLLGNLFKYRKTNMVKRNLMIFLRPRILRDAHQESVISQEKYNFLRAEQLRVNALPGNMTPDREQPLMPAAPTTPLDE